MFRPLPSLSNPDKCVNLFNMHFGNMMTSLFDMRTSATNSNTTSFGRGEFFSIHKCFRMWITVDSR